MVSVGLQAPPVYNLDDLGSHYLQCPHVQTSNLRGNAPVLLLPKLGAKEAVSRWQPWLLRYILNPYVYGRQTAKRVLYSENSIFYVAPSIFKRQKNKKKKKKPFDTKMVIIISIKTNISSNCTNHLHLISQCQENVTLNNFTKCV